jgi:hypothetical protein
MGGFMKKKFYSLALKLIVATALLSVIFAIIYYLASEVIVAGEPMLIFLFYVKKAFDLLAVFTGYGTIIYAFSRYSYVDGLKLTGMFAISVIISFVYQVIGTCFFDSSKLSFELVITTIYYAFGDCFITQYIPALVIAFVAYKSTMDGTKRIEKFVSWKNPTQRVMILVTLVIFAINFVAQLIFDILAFLIEVEWMIYIDELGSILASILETAIIYIVVQYAIYMLTHNIYSKYTDHAGTGNEVLQ